MLLLARHQFLIPHGVCTKWDKYSMQLTQSTKEAFIEYKVIFKMFLEVKQHVVAV